MPLSELVVEIAVTKMNSFKPDYSLYDAIAEMDDRTLRHLVNKVYKHEIMSKPYVSEKLNMIRMSRLLEQRLNQKRINVII